MFEQSKKAISSISNALKGILDLISFIVFIGFTIFYIYGIFSHLNSVPRMVIYIVLIIIHSVSFILSRTIKVDKSATHAEKYVKKKSIRNRKRFFKILKMTVNTGAIIWSIVEIVTNQVSQLRIVIVVISSISLFTQIIIEIFINLFIAYFDTLRIAVIDDIQTADQKSSFKVKFLAKIMGQSKNLKTITDDDYLSEEEKEIARKHREKKR